MEPNADTEGGVGPLDETALEQIRDEFATLDGLVIDQDSTVYWIQQNSSCGSTTVLELRIHVGLMFDGTTQDTTTFTILTSKTLIFDLTTIRNQMLRTNISIPHPTRRHITHNGRVLARQSPDW